MRNLRPGEPFGRWKSNLGILSDACDGEEDFGARSEVLLMITPSITEFRNPHTAPLKAQDTLQEYWI